MFSNFIGGGQIFLHKVRMFGQVFFKSLNVSISTGIIIGMLLHCNSLKSVDWDAFISYRKASFAVGFLEFTNSFRESVGNDLINKTYINAKTNNRIYKEIDADIVIQHSIFTNANDRVFKIFWSIFILSLKVCIGFFILVFSWWSKFGSNLKSERVKKGSDQILSAKQVKKELKKMKMTSSIKIGDMPIVKDSETRHFLITGSTGSGKTNLFHNILPQVQRQNHPAIIIDQTGEMIAKYYNEERGDIIFNPFDERGSIWDFWKDCESSEELERFSKILFGFNRKSSNHNSDPFWEQSAEVIFIASVEKLQKDKNLSVEELTKLVRFTNRKTLKVKLEGTRASRYLDEDSRSTASSILSVLATSTKPLSYLRDTKYASSLFQNTSGEECGTNLEPKTFSLKEYFAGVKEGKKAWLFIAAKPSARDLTLPISACLTELALSGLMDVGIRTDRRVWFVFDELASLKKLPALSTLISEGRKYGACILAGLQSLNQLYEYYGHHGGSTIFGQFGTNFFFRNTEPSIGKLVSSMCGMEILTTHQKNTSFGANEFRDGVSYNEQEKKKNLVDYSDLANLKVMECFVMLPEPKVRISKILVPPSKLQDKNDGFIQKETFVNLYASTDSYLIDKDDSKNSSDTDGLAAHWSEKPRSKAKGPEKEALPSILDIPDLDK